MPSTRNPNRSVRRNAERFATTHWSVVLTAAREDSQGARPALEQLCRTYWYPLYAFARRTGCSPDDAKDLTQGFFAKLLEKQYLADVDPELGRFRSFLLASFKHFAVHERDRARAKKRGGGHVAVTIEVQDAEARYALEPVHNTTAELIFERRWALTLLERILDRLGDEYAAAGKADRFEQLKGVLTGDAALSAYAVIGNHLDLSEGAVKVAAHRLRRRYRKLLRAEIARTVLSPHEVDDELRHLLNVLSG